jgi:hypothetical protein
MKIKHWAMTEGRIVWVKYLIIALVMFSWSMSEATEVSVEMGCGMSEQDYYTVWYDGYYNKVTASSNAVYWNQLSNVGKLGSHDAYTFGQAEIGHLQAGANIMSALPPHRLLIHPNQAARPITLRRMRAG